MSTDNCRSISKMCIRDRVCTDIRRYAPLLEADFQPADTPDAHPGHALRARVAGPAAEQPNQVLELLVGLFGLPVSRATGQDLVDLCSLCLLYTSRCV